MSAPKINQPDPVPKPPVKQEEVVKQEEAMKLEVVKQEEAKQETPVKQEEAKQETPVEPTGKPNDDKAFSARERVPSDWEINAADGDAIYARNNSTGRVFEGTIAEFNQKLRG